MKTAQDYPVTFPYGATSSPYTKSNPHLGEDRSMPLNTPIVVNGVTIGLAGTTGKSTGVHLHIQKVSKGYVVSPRGGGFNLPKPATVYATGYGKNIGNYVRIRDAKGVEWSYFHMNKVNARKGQVVEENDMYKGRSAKDWYNRLSAQVKETKKAVRIAETRLKEINKLKKQTNSEDSKEAGKWRSLLELLGLKK